MRRIWLTDSLLTSGSHSVAKLAADRSVAYAVRRAVALRVPFHSAESLLFGLSACGFRSEHAVRDGLRGSVRTPRGLRAV